MIQNNGASVERLRVDEATWNVSRNGALFVHTTAPGNTFVGGSGEHVDAGHRKELGPREERPAL